MKRVNLHTQHLVCSTISEVAHSISYKLGSDQFSEDDVEDILTEAAQLRAEVDKLFIGLASALAMKSAA